jgi:hypothetical protein
MTANKNNWQDDEKQQINSKQQMTTNNDAELMLLNTNKN